MGDKVERTTISLPPGLWHRAEARRKALDYKNFSQYVAFLIQKDVEERPVHVIVKKEPGQRYHVENLRAAEEDGGAPKSSKK